ncbi:MAG: response regulator transcription factor [Anaerolineae bacterium]|nr:response regulator transcription factor [Anaerolineae bacterium]
MTAIRVLVIADNLLARAGLAALLAEQTELTVVGQIAAGDNLIDDLDVYRPDVLVWDFGWQPGPVLERYSALVNELSDDSNLPILALLPDETYAAEVGALLRTMQAGGVFLSDSDTQQLIAALLAVAAGVVAIDPTLVDAVLTSGEAQPEAPADALTPREVEVLHMLAEGLANKVIARRLGISDHTVKFHVNAIMSKLDTQSRTGAVVKAIRLGLIAL